MVSGNIFNKSHADMLNIKGPFRRYAIDIAADAKDIQITPTPDGHYQFQTYLRHDPFGVPSTPPSNPVQTIKTNAQPSSTLS